MFAALFAALAMASAALAPAQEAVVEKSIADLRNHRPAFEAVRNVRLTTVHDLDGAPRQLVCGEVRLGDRWDPFGSRETMSGYEHLVGGLARSWCDEPGLTWSSDPELNRRFEAGVVGS